MNIYLELFKMIYLNIFLHVSSGHSVCNIFIYNMFSYNFPFPLSFQNITLVCWKLSLHALIIKLIHKYLQNEWYLENKKGVEIMRDNIVDDNVLHTMTSRIMNAMQ